MSQSHRIPAPTPSVAGSQNSVANDDIDKARMYAPRGWAGTILSVFSMFAQRLVTVTGLGKTYEDIVDYINGAPFTTGLSAVATAGVTISRANGPFQKITLSGTEAARVITITDTAAAEATIGRRLELWIKATANAGQTLRFAENVTLLPGESAISWPITMSANGTYIALLKHDGTDWMLVSFIGAYTPNGA